MSDVPITDKMRVMVVAEEHEAKLVEGPWEVIVTGIGALNVMSSLADVNRDVPLINVGYAGSNTIPKGETVRVGAVRLYHPCVEYNEPEYTLDGSVPCYTSTDFVTETDMTEPCLFDMELAFILAMGFSDVIAEKVVSDNLCMDEHRDMISENKDG